METHGKTLEYYLNFIERSWWVAVIVGFIFGLILKRRTENSSIWKELISNAVSIIISGVVLYLMTDAVPRLVSRVENISPNSFSIYRALDLIAALTATLLSAGSVLVVIFSVGMISSLITILSREKLSQFFK